ncbi:MAG: DUF4149 domain-containing protein [Acidiphilium sp.]|nr:DUF4149 domain-containing protein [Acidiphilium sp.]MDD4935238.1 DUF4149 domain-containing protein [Acidiphilium sp.]
MLAVMGLSALFGGMLFFGAIVTPLVFGKLPPDVAGPFIRAAFPRYYLFMVITSVIAALGLLLRGSIWYALGSGLIAAVTLWLWLKWLPHLNAVRDAGDKLAFGRGHRLSVWLNGAEFLVVILLLAGITA